jgi:hypothetical protein
MSTSAAQRIFSVIGWAAPGWGEGGTARALIIRANSDAEGLSACSFPSHPERPSDLTAPGQIDLDQLAKSRPERAKQGRERLVLTGVDKIQRPGGKRSSAEARHPAVMRASGQGRQRGPTRVSCRGGIEATPTTQNNTTVIPSLAKRGLGRGRIVFITTVSVVTGHQAPSACIDLKTLLRPRHALRPHTLSPR